MKPRSPKIEDTGVSVIVTIFSPEGFEFLGLEINERQKKALEFIKRKGRITNREYREMFNIVKDTAIRDLKELVDKKIIVKKGAGRNVYYVLK